MKKQSFFFSKGEICQINHKYSPAHCYFLAEASHQAKLQRPQLSLGLRKADTTFFLENLKMTYSSKSRI